MGLDGSRPSLVALALSFLVGLTVVSGGGAVDAFVRWLLGSPGLG